MNTVPIVCGCVSWSSAIGNFQLNFGTLEYFILVFLKDRLSPEEFAKVRELSLKNRVARIAKYLSDEKRVPAEQIAFARLTESLNPIRELRNHIAHGHMFLQLDPKTQTPVVTVLKAKDLDLEHSPHTKHLEISELAAASQTLRKLIEEFQQLAGFATQS